MANQAVIRLRGGRLIHVCVAMLSSFLSAAFFFEKKAAKRINNQGEKNEEFQIPSGMVESSIKKAPADNQPRL